VITTEMIVELEPDFLPSSEYLAEVLEEAIIEAIVEVKWRVTRRGHFDQWGQVWEDEFHEVQDVELLGILWDGKPVQLQLVHPDLRDAVGTHPFIKAVRRIGFRGGEQ
jgi:hypothetical protein